MSATYLSEIHNGVRVIFVPEDGCLVTEFDKRLHREGFTFDVYAIKPELPPQLEHDPASEMLVNIVKVIFFLNPDSGVESLKVRAYKLIIAHSRAVDVNDVAQLVRDGMNLRLQSS